MKLKREETKEKLPGSMMFNELPVDLQEEVIAEAMASTSLYDWPQDHPSYLEGKKAAMTWLYSASLEDISIVADGSPDPTYISITAGTFDADEEDTLCYSEAGFEVSKILGFNELAPATEENVNFEAGFHLGLGLVDQIIMGSFDVKY